MLGLSLRHIQFSLKNTLKTHFDRTYMQGGLMGISCFCPCLKFITLAKDDDVSDVGKKTGMSCTQFHSFLLIITFPSRLLACVYESWQVVKLSSLLCWKFTFEFKEFLWQEFLLGNYNITLEIFESDSLMWKAWGGCDIFDSTPCYKLFSIKIHKNFFLSICHRLFSVLLTK